MLCSGKELGLTDDGAGLLILGDESPGEPGTPIMEALGLRADTVFDITVEGNRPDAWCISGIARDLAGRLELPFTLPEPPEPAASGWPVEEAASASVESADLCPRLTVSVLRDVTVGPSPGWIAQRLLLAGMRPINNVVDASNYVMLELGPAHPPLRPVAPARARADGPAGPTRARRSRRSTACSARSGERGRSLGDTGEDCLICDAEGTPVGIGGIMGGASSEIAETTTEVLLEAAYFTPMAIARTSKRLGLRTEASARFERGVDPWVIEPSVRRFCQLLAESVPGLTVADGMLDVRGDVPEPFVVSRADRPGAQPDRGRARAGRDRPPHRADRLHGAGAGARRGRRRADRPGADEPPRRPARALRRSTTSLRRSPARSATPTCRAGSRPGPSRAG